MTVQTKIDIAEVAEVLNQAELSKLRRNRKQLLGTALLAIVGAAGSAATDLKIVFHNNQLVSRFRPGLHPTQQGPDLLEPSFFRCFAARAAVASLGQAQ